MPLAYVTITGTFEDGTGSPLSGTVTFTPSSTVYSTGAAIVSEESPITAKVTAGTLAGPGGSPLQLLATDAGTAVEGLTGFWYWNVTVNVAGEQTWSFFLPSSPSTVDLYDLVSTGTSGAGAGTVQSVTVESANGLAGTVADATTTPQITLSTSITGLLKGDGTAVSAAAPGTDYLTPSGNGSALTGLTQSQISGLSTALAALLPLAGGTMTGPLAPKVVALTDAATITVNAALGNDFRVTLGGNRTIGAPSNPVDGQDITFLLTQPGSGGPYTATWTSGTGGYSFGAGSAPSLSAAAGDADMLAFKYVSAKSAWLFMGSSGGF